LGFLNHQQYEPINGNDYINESFNPKEEGGGAFSVGNFFFDISEIEAVQGWDILGPPFKRQHRDTVTRCAEG